MEVRSELCSICTRVEIELECQTVPVGSLPEGCDVSDFELDLRGGVVHECLLDVVEDAMLVDADVVVVAALVPDVHWPNRRPTKITMPMLRRCRGTGTRRHDT